MKRHIQEELHGSLIEWHTFAQILNARDLFKRYGRNTSHVFFLLNLTLSGICTNVDCLSMYIQRLNL